MCEVSTRILHWLRRWCDNGKKIQDRPEPKSMLHNKTRRGTSQTCLKIIWPYWPTDRNFFQEDAPRRWNESICEVSTKLLHWLRRICDNRKSPRWPMTAMIVNGQNRRCTTRPPEEHPRQVSKTSDPWSRRCDNAVVTMRIGRVYGVRKMADGGHLWRCAGNKLEDARLHLQGNISDKFRKNRPLVLEVMR